MTTPRCDYFGVPCDRPVTHTADVFYDGTAAVTWMRLCARHARAFDLLHARYHLGKCRPLR